MNNYNLIKDLIEKLSMLSAAELAEILDLANKYINSDPKSSLTKSREALERIVLEIYKEEMKEEPKRVELGFMLNNNQFTRKIDTRILKSMNYVRDMGNMGPHSLNGQVEEIDAVRVLDQLSDIINWYLIRYQATDQRAETLQSHIPQIVGDDDFELAVKFDHEENYIDSFFHYSQAANIGHIEAQYQLGLFFKVGKGVVQNVKEAMKWFEKAALQGNVEAKYEIACSFYKEKQYEQALTWFEEAAAHGHVEAQSQLGIMYKEGLGTEVNFVQCLTWLKKASAANDAMALTQYGLLFVEGKFVQPNYAKAFELFSKAAQLHYAEAKYRLATLYGSGLGVGVDHEKASYWYDEALKGGYEEKLYHNETIEDNSIELGRIEFVGKTDVENTRESQDQEEYKHFLKGEKGIYKIKYYLSGNEHSTVMLCEKDEKEFIGKVSKYSGRDPIVTEMLKGMNNKRVIQIVDEGLHKGDPFEITPYYSKGDLRSIKPVRAEYDVYKLVEQMNEILRSIHSRNIIHGDIKPSNLFMNEMFEPVIGDFDTARFNEVHATDYAYMVNHGPVVYYANDKYRITEDYMETVMFLSCTPGYAAPEIYRGARLYKSDYYSLGIMILDLVSWDFPFKGMTEKEMIQMTLEKRIPIPPYISKNIQTLIKGLTIHEPNHRWGFYEVYNFLQGKEVPIIE